MTAVGRNLTPYLLILRPNLFNSEDFDVILNFGCMAGIRLLSFYPNTLFLGDRVKWWYFTVFSSFCCTLQLLSQTTTMLLPSSSVDIFWASRSHIHITPMDFRNFVVFLRVPPHVSNCFGVTPKHLLFINFGTVCTRTSQSTQLPVNHVLIYLGPFDLSSTSPTFLSW